MGERVTYYVQYSGVRGLGYEVVGAEHGYAIAECARKDHAERIAAALNAQAGVVEALRPLEEALALFDSRADEALLNADNPFNDALSVTVARIDGVISAARAALAAVKEKDRG